jgi:hypothetical protein
MKQITVTMKQVYGNTTYYPACADSLLFARIAGTKTLTPAALATIKALEYRIVLQQENPTIADIVV